MIAALVASVAFQSAQAHVVADFYPLIVGTKWTYSGTGGMGEETIDTVAAPIELNGQMFHKVSTSIGMGQTSVTLYKVTEDTVYVAGYDAAKLLKEPQPILKFTGTRTKWSYEGSTPFFDILAPFALKGESWPSGKKKFLGYEAETMQAKVEATIQVGPKEIVISKQKATYAKGFGLIEMEEEVISGESKRKRTLKLTGFEAGKQ